MEAGGSGATGPSCGSLPGVRLGLRQSHRVQAPGEGAGRVIGLRLDSEVRLRGGAAACGAARSAAAGAQREVLGLRGVVHVVGGPDVLHGAAALAPTAGEVAGAMAATTVGVGAAATGWVGCGTRRRRSLRPGPRHGLGAGEHALPASARPPSSQRPRPHPRRQRLPHPPPQPPLPSPLWPVLRHAPPPARAPRLVQEALYVVGSADDLRCGCGCGPGRGNTFRRTNSAASWGSWERKACAAASPAAPAPTRPAAACAPSAALRRRPVIEGGP